MSMSHIHVIRGTVALLVLAALFHGIPARAQYGKYLEAIYDARSVQLDDGKVPYHSVGAALSYCPDLFYPWPVYIQTGLNTLFSIKREGANTPANYRFEIPLELTVQWDPSPFFTIGPFVGAYGALNLLVAPEDPSRFNTWQYGVMAGLSIYPSYFHIHVGYYHDMVPFNKNGTGLDGIRVGIGMIL